MTIKTIWGKTVVRLCIARARLLMAFVFLLLPLLNPVVLFASQTGSVTSEKTEVVLTYLMIEDEEYYEPPRLYTGVQLKIPQRPLAGLLQALRESRIPARAANLKISLQEIAATSSQSVVERAKLSVDETGPGFFVLDLPPELQKKVVDELGGDNLYINPRNSHNYLRLNQCQSKLFHTIPSNAMLHDSLVQFLARNNWKQILVMTGTNPEDVALTESFSRSVKRFGLKITDTIQFKLSNNPRDRNKTNIRLMTTGKKYDVVFIADAVGEFGRYIPYQTKAARPVIGSEGLVPAAWHWTWERHGAPQLNQRFRKKNKRNMSDSEWAGWVAGKALTQALIKTGQVDTKSVREYLLSDETTLDLYKGNPGNFRAWSGQLRQPLLLHTHNAVIDRAPFDEYLHEFNVLDTLGFDRADVECE